MEENQISRKSYVAPPLSDANKEMAIITHAKKLSMYVFTITEKSPKKYRWSVIGRLQNATIDLIENLYRANYEKDEKRLNFQKAAMFALQLIDFYAETAKSLGGITMHQMQVMASQIVECKKLLAGWVRSVKKK